MVFSVIKPSAIIAKVFWLLGIFNIRRLWHTRKRQQPIHSSDGIVTGEEVQSETHAQVEQVDRDEAVVQVAGSCIQAISLHIPLEGDFALFWRLKTACRKEHIFRVIEYLYFVVSARQLRGNAHSFAFYHYRRVRLAVAPEAAIGQGKAAVDPGTVNPCNNAVVPRVGYGFFLLLFFHCAFCRCRLH